MKRCPGRVIASAVCLGALFVTGVSCAVPTPEPTQMTVSQLVDYRVVVRAGLKGDNSPIRGAAVRIAGVSQTWTTDSDGYTPVIQLPQGTYTMEVTSKGWQSVEASDIELAGNGVHDSFVYMTKGSGLDKRSGKGKPRSAPMTPNEKKDPHPS